MPKIETETRTEARVVTKTENVQVTELVVRISREELNDLLHPLLWISSGNANFPNAYDRERNAVVLFAKAIADKSLL